MNKPNRNFKQKGNMLLLIMLSLLFLGGLALSTTDLISSKQREAASNLPEASLEAAIYASYNYIKSTSQTEFAEANSFKTSKEACEAAYAILNTKLSKNAVYLEHANKNQSISWEFNIEKDCSNIQKPILANIKSWQGKKDNPISMLTAKTSINFDDDPSPNQNFSNYLGDNAVTSANKIELKGNSSITGSVDANELNLSTTASIHDVEKEDYSNTVSYKTCKNCNNLSSNLNTVEKNSDEAASTDPLNLLVELNEKLHYIKPDGSKVYIEELRNPTSSLPNYGYHYIYPMEYYSANSNGSNKTKRNNIKFYHPVMFYNQPVSMGFANELSLTSNSTLDISGGDVYIYLEGDLTINGGATVKIAPDSTLTIITRGRAIIYNGVLWRFNSNYNALNKPYFNILSTDENRKRGLFGFIVGLLSGVGSESVTITKNATHRGFIYSLGDIKLQDNATMEGQVFGQNIELNKGSKIEYKDAEIEDITGSTGTQEDIILDFKLNFKSGLEF